MTAFLKLIFQKSLVFLPVIFKLTDLSGQVPVHEEPRHHVVFQNKELRILNVLLPPGDTSLFHTHTTPSLFIRLSATTTGSQLLGGKASAGNSVAGTILFENLAPPDTRAHRVWNTDTDTFRVMDLELLFHDTGFVQKPLTIPNLVLEIDTAWIRVYRLTLPQGIDFILKNNKQSFILISLDAAAIQTNQSGKTQYHTLIPGWFYDIKKKHTFSIKNLSDHTSQFILVELPRH